MPPPRKGGTLPEPPEPAVLAPAEVAVPLSVELDELFYGTGSTISVKLVDPSKLLDDSKTAALVLVAPDSKDVEEVRLTREDEALESDGKLRLETAGTPTPQDGVLRAAPGEIIYALYFVDQKQPRQAALGAKIVADFAFVEQVDGDASSELLPDIALTDDEAGSPRPAGTLLREKSLPVQVATRELIVYTRSDDELDAFLERSGGELVDSVPKDEGEPYQAHLVEVDTSMARSDQLDRLRALVGEEDTLYASNEDALRILSLALEYRLEGYLVAVNPALQMSGVPAISNTEINNVTHTMEMRGARRATSKCIPGDSTRACVENVPALWAYLALWEHDAQRVPVAVLDMGFAPNQDFRRPAGGEFVECDMTSISPAFRCESGSAEGPPTVGNSFFGGRSWHGTGVVSTIGAVVNDGFGVAGVAGQVAEPMLYKYDTLAYAFDMGRGIRKATEDGAACINISGGYPCNVLTVGPDFNICSVGGRASLCAVLTAGVAAAAAVACAATGWIPIVGQVACGVAVAGAATAVSGCLATLAFGNLRGPMESAVAFAERKGVPVVTIAGNTLSESSMPAIVRDIVDLSDRTTDSWGIVPAMIPQTIVAGAANENLDNAHFYGDRVDVWAPISSAYMAPSDVDDPDSSLRVESIGGTSAAAPFVTGVIASMMAVNPDLNPKSKFLNDSQRGSIVGRIKQILTSPEATFDNAELVALGYSDQPVERRNLIDPLSAVRLAAPEGERAVSALGYDTSLGFSEERHLDDTESAAIPLDIGDSTTGTIIAIPRVDASTTQDVDFYRFTMPSSPARPQEAVLTLTFPTNTSGEPYVQAKNSRPSDSAREGAESIREFRVLADAGTRVPFRVSGEDSLYKIEVTSTEPAVPSVEIWQPIDESPVCANKPFVARAEAWFPGFYGFEVPDDALTWSVDEETAGTGEVVTLSLSAGTHVIGVSAYEDSDASDSITLTARTCTNDPPEPVITTPATDLVGGTALFFTGFDEEKALWYTDVELVGSATDTEDGELSGNQLVWRTNQGSIQDTVLGTGTAISARLYASDACAGAAHTITLQATDLDGNPSVAITRQIVIFTIC